MTTAEVGPVWMETIKCVGQVLSLGGVKSSAGREEEAYHSQTRDGFVLPVFVCSFFLCIFLTTKGKVCTSWSSSSSLASDRVVIRIFSLPEQYREPTSRPHPAEQINNVRITQLN